MDEVAEDATVGTLPITLPTFWSDKPEAWFGQAEANFRARRITSKKTQFNLVVVALDVDTVDSVLDLLEHPHVEDAYDQLKDRLLQSLKLSTVEKIKQVLEFTAVADENPVKLADKIMAWTRDASAEDIAKTVFLLKLPEGVRKTMWAEPLAAWTEMKARASRLWHADRTETRASGYVAANVGDQDTKAIKPKRRVPRASKVREAMDGGKQRTNGPCLQAGNEGAGHQ